MLDIKNAEKTFNPGTINEKKALNGINLHLNEGDFVTVIEEKNSGMLLQNQGDIFSLFTVLICLLFYAIIKNNIYD